MNTDQEEDDTLLTQATLAEKTWGPDKKEKNDGKQNVQTREKYNAEDREREEEIEAQ